MIIPTSALLLLLPFLPAAFSAGAQIPAHDYPLSVELARQARVHARSAAPAAYPHPHHAKLAMGKPYYAPFAPRATGGATLSPKRRRAPDSELVKIRATKGEREGQRRVRKRKTCIAKSSSSAPAATSSIPGNAQIATAGHTTTSSSAAAVATQVVTVDPAGAGPFYGQSTYYVLGSDGSSIGACGTSLVDTDYIAAASQLLYDSWPGATGNPNTNPICGQKAKVTYNGKSVTVAIADRCESCAMRDLDLSEAAFSQLAAFSVGRMEMTWEWVA